LLQARSRQRRDTRAPGDNRISVRMFQGAVTVGEPVR